jgi:hypothetical protein
VGQELGQEIMSRQWPGGMMVAAGGLGLEGVTIFQPLMAQLVEPGWGELEPLGGRESVQLAGVEGRQDLLDVERRDTVS